MIQASFGQEISKKGVSYYHESFHEFIDTQHKECGDIASILEDKAGNIWLGTDGNGLYVKEKQKGFAIRKLSIPDIAIISLLEDHKGRIWAGSYQDGLFCYENNSIRHFYSREQPTAIQWRMEYEGRPIMELMDRLCTGNFGLF